MSSIAIHHVSKRFDQTEVLCDFTQTIADREFVTLLGPSGCGKTTMLRIIAGFESPTTGTVSIGDTVVFGDGIFVPPEKRDIGMVFQSYAVWPHMTVFDNIAYPLKVKKLSRRTIEQKVGHIMEIVHLSPYAKRLPSQLSGGQQQRIALGRALVAEPGLLLLDEPLSNLDAKLRESMRFEIKELQKKLGITVIYVTHDQVEAMTMSDRIIILNKGEIQQIGTPAEIYCHPANRFVAGFVGKIVLLEAKAGGGRLMLEGTGGQSLPYDGPLSGRVTVGIRPENIHFGTEGNCLRGTVCARAFMGDVHDCSVSLGEASLRLIAPPETYDIYHEADEVSVSISQFHLFTDDQ